MAGPGRQGPLLRELQAPGLARLAPAILGLSDPDPVLRSVRHAPGAGRGPARRAARDRGLPAEGSLAAGRGGGLGQRPLSGMRRPREARDGHDGHVRRLELVLPALLRRAQRQGGVGPADPAQLDARRPVHRWRRARDPAPDVFALLRQGARGHGPARRPGAVPGAVHPGDDPRPGRQQDVELEGQRDRPERDHRAVRRRRRPLLRAVHRAGRSGRRVVGHRHRRRVSEAPVPALAFGRRDRRPGRRLRTSRRIRPQKR